MDIIGNILYDTIYHSAPIILCVIGGIFAYKANVLNIALEGMMLIGAFVSTLTAFMTQNIALGVLLAVLAALAFGVVFSLMGVTFKGNVIIIGLAINLLASAIAKFVLVRMNTSNITLSFMNVADLKLHIPVVENIPLVGSILSDHPLITYISFLGIFFMWVLMYKTRFGIYVRVVGENEDAAKSIGLKTDFYKYAAILIGAVCCGLAGANLSTERLGLFTNDMTAGRGFIAIAAIYCGQGSPTLSAIYAVVFGLARALSVNLSIYAGPAAGLFDVIPYVIMVCVLTVVSVLKHKNNKVRGFKNE
ncbi:ABC transporter permease [Caproiciproducens galactitolivorans]|uniref:Beta-methylgalactoside transporter inner membrane component n=1 Tax=Caproiciproducens galactitolivorans TaxID=642589 RepID=A0A4Z0Y9F9_9FIRM|nr:ABC transporter permease [Caproiciproducens galactitolivorans]QEY33680.1 ABC transporter permease [Caproiciproducens galactitolivorans]TGJ76195.1 beta-methylgalactoside transporter inner membrane component [Caproiciproducens galactitolivorans]